nr:immunoglobulin heavy chain junction region [Mus musculus]
CARYHVYYAMDQW